MRSLQCPICEVVFANRTRKSVHVRKGCKGAVLDFLSTDLEAVKVMVSENPAPFQAAALLGPGVLHMELCRQTHFGTLPQNRNVFTVQGKGTQMRVLDDGKPVQWLKKIGLNQILINNREVLADARVQPFFKSSLNGTGQATRADVEIAVHLRGVYPMLARVLADAARVA